MYICSPSLVPRPLYLEVVENEGLVCIVLACILFWTKILLNRLFPSKSVCCLYVHHCHKVANGAYYFFLCLRSRFLKCISYILQNNVGFIHKHDMVHYSQLQFSLHVLYKQWWGGFIWKHGMVDYSHFLLFACADAHVTRNFKRFLKEIYQM